MKVYETITQAKDSEITKLPGIYYFKNKINNKYYIGQAVCIRKRFQSHYHQIQIKNENYPIYKAINKYGLDNFEFGIIGVFKIQQDDINILKRKLDILEIKYIKEYNSFGNTGYNQTKGGDGGILGYKMTDEQRKHISENSRKMGNDGRNTVYIYDLKNKIEYEFTSFQTAADYLNVKRDSLYAAYRRKGIGLKQFISSRNKNELKEMIESFNKECTKTKVGLIRNSGFFKEKYSLEEYIKIKNDNPKLTASELASLMGVCKKTIYNYEQLLDNPTFVKKEEIKYKIINTFTNEEKIISAKEGAKLFGISDTQFRKTEKYHRNRSSLYRKTYKIIRLN